MVFDQRLLVPLNSWLIETEIAKHVSSVTHITKPYNELFADLLEALVLDDGANGANSLEFSHSTPYTYMPFDGDSPVVYNGRLANPNGPRPRDFTSTSSFRDWRPEKKSEEYVMFDPVRGAIWSGYYDPAMGFGGKQLVIRSFLLAAEIHIRERLLRGELESGAEEDWSQLNREFFRIFTTQARVNLTR